MGHDQTVLIFRTNYPPTLLPSPWYVWRVTIVASVDNYTDLAWAREHPEEIDRAPTFSSSEGAEAYALMLTRTDRHARTIARIKHNEVWSPRDRK
jgi:hypothetical protein